MADDFRAPAFDAPPPMTRLSPVSPALLAQVGPYRVVTLRITPPRPARPQSESA